MTLTARIKEIIRHCGLSDMAFEHEIGLTRDRLTSVLRRNGDKYSSDILIAICERYTEINPAWLLLEDGEMLLGGNRKPSIKIESKPISAEPQQEPVVSDSVYKQLYEDTREQIKSKDARISDLEHQLQEKDRALNDTINKMQDRLDRKDADRQETEKEHLRTIRQLAEKVQKSSSSSSVIDYPYGVAESRRSSV